MEWQIKDSDLHGIWTYIQPQTDLNYIQSRRNKELNATEDGLMFKTIEIQ